MIPPLRSDLVLIPGPAEWDGTPTWTIHDTVRNIFFRIGWIERSMLRHWHQGDSAHIAAATATELGSAVDCQAVIAFAAFLAQNQLVRDDTATMPAPRRHGILTTLLHGYLYFRIPLGSPDRVVAALAPRLAWVLRSRGFAIFMLACTVWGLMRTAGQWDVFIATLPPLSTPGGLAVYGAMLALSAVVHEFGHAFATRHFGCRIGTMGIAFVVMVPTLYTDTTDTWRLSQSRHRLAVAAAGIAAELLLVLPMLAVWSHLPEGPARSAAVTLATTALAATLAINLSPFMRFDGYFMLSDLLGVANLQDRAFALLRWRLRRLLFGLAAPAPEMLPTRLHATLLAWAVVTLIYRAGLYLGIALFVYHSVFKLAGMVLFCVEFGWFLARPCWSEMRAWWHLRAAMSGPRLALSLAVLAAALAGLVLPWSQGVDLPATLDAAHHSVLFPRQAGRVALSRLTLGTPVAAGELLVELDAPLLRNTLDEVDIRLAAAQWQVDHLIARDAAWERLRVEEETLAAIKRERAAIQDQLARLEIRAPFAGTIIEHDPALTAGRWVAAKDRLAELADISQCRVTAYGDENDLGRLQTGAAGKFYADGLDLEPVAITLTRIDATASRRLDDLYFAADFGGAIAVRRNGAGAIPARAIFGVHFQVTGPADCRMRRRGTVMVDAKAESVIYHLARLAVSIFNEERGL